MRRVGIVLLVAVIAVSTGNVFARISLEDDSQKQMGMTNLSSMPLAFAENRGQWDEKAMFKANAGGATFYFCNNEVTYLFVRDTDELFEDSKLKRRQEPIPDALPIDGPRYKKETLLIKAQFIGINPNHEIISADRLSHNNNYFYGNNPLRLVNSFSCRLAVKRSFEAMAHLKAKGRRR